MRIAVLSDSHNRLPRHVPEAIRGADEIWHLGDVVSPGLIDLLRDLGRPMRVVRGNCDECTDWPFDAEVSIAGRRFFLTHIPPHEVPSGVEFVLHGHTHVPRDEMLRGTRFLNPGSVGAGNRGAPPSFAWLEVDGNGRVTWSIVRV